MVPAAEQIRFIISRLALASIIDLLGLLIYKLINAGHFFNRKYENRKTRCTAIGGTQTAHTQRYWLSMLFIVRAPPILDNAIGTVTKIDNNEHSSECLMAFVSDVLNQTTGITTINAINQPAPNGNGKYSVQTEVGTVFENKKISGNTMIASPKSIPLTTTPKLLRCTGISTHVICH